MIDDVTAAILVGGLGKRLQSVVNNMPKVLAKVAEQPFLIFLFDQLIKTGIKSAVLCTGYKGEQIQTMFGNKYRSLNLSYSQEKSPLGTGGALKYAEPMLHSKYILVMNGDSYVHTDLNAFCNWHEKLKADISIILVKIKNGNRFGKVSVNKNNKITSFSEKSEMSKSNWINAGIYMMNREILKLMPNEFPYSIEKQFFPALIGKGFYGYKVESDFIDIGIPESYSKAELFFEKLTSKKNKTKNGNI